MGVWNSREILEGCLSVGHSAPRRSYIPTSYVLFQRKYDDANILIVYQARDCVETLSSFQNHFQRENKGKKKRKDFSAALQSYNNFFFSLISSFKMRCSVFFVRLSWQTRGPINCFPRTCQPRNVSREELGPRVLYLYLCPRRVARNAGARCPGLCWGLRGSFERGASPSPPATWRVPTPRVPRLHPHHDANEGRGSFYKGHFFRGTTFIDSTPPPLPLVRASIESQLPIASFYADCKEQFENQRYRLFVVVLHFFRSFKMNY